MGMESSGRGQYEIEAEMSFGEIGERLGISHQAVIKTYQRAIRKLAKDAYAIERLQDWAAFHRALRARSAECRARQEGYY